MLSGIVLIKHMLPGWKFITGSMGALIKTFYPA